MSFNILIMFYVKLINKKKIYKEKVKVFFVDFKELNLQIQDYFNGFNEITLFETYLMDICFFFKKNKVIPQPTK